MALFLIKRINLLSHCVQYISLILKRVLFANNKINYKNTETLKAKRIKKL